MTAHPGTVVFVDKLLGTETVKDAANMPASVTFIDDVPVTRFVIEAAPDNGRRILAYGFDGTLLRTTIMVYRDSVHPIRGNSGLTLPPSSAASTAQILDLGRGLAGVLVSHAVPTFREVETAIDYL